MVNVSVPENAEQSLARHPVATREPTGGASFGCGPGYEELAEELAGLVGGTWRLTSGVRTVLILANGATVPRELPGKPSQEAQDWWHVAVTTRLAPTPHAGVTHTHRRSQ